MINIPAYIVGLTGAIVGHLLGDFVVQNDWMALNKKHKTWPCLVHVVIYTCCVILLSNWWVEDWQQNAYLFLAIAIPHFIIDRSCFISSWMDLVGQKKFRSGVCAPWSSIVVDNVWHLLCLYLAAWWWFS